MNSDDSISWHAHREAESLSDSSMVDELAEYLTHERDKNRRGAAYFILGKLGQKVRGRDCASILLSRLHHEKNKYVSKPRNIDLGPVFGLLNDGRLIVRHSAIRALSRTDSPEAEDQLIDLLKATSEQNDMVYCQATLNEIGTT